MAATPFGGGAGGAGAPVVDAIVRYPVKGAGGAPLEEARVDEFGIHLDRRWMLVDAEGVFLSQRHHPQLALLRPRVESDALVLEAPGTESLAVALEPEGATVEVRVWDSVVEAVEVGAGTAEWAEAFLGEPARLVFMPRSTLRPVERAHLPPDRPSGGGERVSFADAYPLLLLSRESLDELNRRLESPVPMNRFRPNLVVRGVGRPHGEDAWRRVRIGELELDVVKPCPRCAVTTVDQASGEKGVEPLRTLAKYRKSGGNTWFGQNLVQRGVGTLRVGDPVQVLESGTPRPRLDQADAGASFLQS